MKVEVTVTPVRGAPRTLKFSVARQQQLTPVIVAAGVSQAILGSNDAGLANGFRLKSDVSFPASARLPAHSFMVTVGIPATGTRTWTLDVGHDGPGSFSVRDISAEFLGMT